MKNSGVEWIGEIPDDWELKKIFWLINFINGYAFDGSSLSLDLDIPVIRIGNISDNKIDYESCLLYKDDKTLEQYSPSEGDILIAMSGATTGKIGIATNRKAYINQRVGIIRSTYNFLLKYYFQISAFDEYIKLLSAGSAQPNISMTQIQDFKIPFPPKETQQKIATYLDSKCSKIEETIQKQQQVIEKLKAYKQSLITEAVTGKIKIQNGKACGKYEEYKDSGVEWIGEIPSGWEPIKAKYFIKISNGSDPKTSEGNTPVYGSGAESFKTCVEYKEGPTVLIGRKGATLHIPHYIEGNYWNVDTAFDVKTYSEENFLLRFYYYCATAFDYKFYLTSTTLPSMTQTNYGNMYLPVPNIQTQKEVVEFLDKQCKNIDTAIEQKEQLIEKLTEYKKSLIYECVTGKKEI
ncbi:MAG: restriction endonuclease subunit S [Treponema sp.]|nr:restriction endonuclease subunit S [Treponema sp.]